MISVEEFSDAISQCEHCSEWDGLVDEMKSDGESEGEYSIGSFDLVKELLELGYKVKGEDGYGGEGQGDEYWVVFSVEKDSEKTFFRLDGWYSSYDGSSFDDTHNFVVVKKVPVESYEWHLV